MKLIWDEKRKVGTLNHWLLSVPSGSCHRTSTILMEVDRDFGSLKGRDFTWRQWQLHFATSAHCCRDSIYTLFLALTPLWAHAQWINETLDALELPLSSHTTISSRLLQTIMHHVGGVGPPTVDLESRILATEAAAHSQIICFERDYAFASATPDPSRSSTRPDAYFQPCKKPSKKKASSISHGFFLLEPASRLAIRILAASRKVRLQLQWRPQKLCFSSR